MSDRCPSSQKIVVYSINFSSVLSVANLDETTVFVKSSSEKFDEVVLREPGSSVILDGCEHLG